MQNAMVTAIELTELYGEALNFKAVDPEKWLKPNQVIAVLDPETDVLAYCTLERHADGFQLSAHLGNEGLRGYLDQVYQETFDGNRAPVKNCLQLSYCHLIDLSPEDYEQIERLDMAMKQFRTFPKFRNHSIGFVPEAIHNGWECRFFTQILKQLTEIVLEYAGGKGDQLVGDEIVLCTHTLAEDWIRLKVPMKVFLEQANDTKFYYRNELEAYRINRLPVMNMTFEITQFYIPTPVRKTRFSRAFYPFVTAAFETFTKQIIFAEIMDYSRQSMEAILDKFAKTVLNDLQFRPKYLVSDSEAVIAFFQDFCDKVNISAQTVPQLETSQDFMKDLINIKNEEELSAITFSTGFEEEIDEVLKSARGICQTILESPLLMEKLNADARRQFISIVELLHVVMMSNFKELPDSWTVKNVELALTTIFPNLLTEEERKHVPQILYHYTDIVGEAQMLPGYFEIKNRIGELYGTGKGDSMVSRM
ncbi:MAG: hypothetical protein FWF59_08235 [Turicibacter sp.]|nr:hypothetical protein [Turicibacter sp.]